MKKLLAILVITALSGINFVYAGNKKGTRPKKQDTLSVKCLLFSPDMFYAIELGEKPVKDMVDTLVGEITQYDSATKLNLVILSGRDLGFTKQSGILWEQIIDSARSRGYGVCPSQAGPEIYVQSQNMVDGHTLLARKVSQGNPIFIGMNKIRHDYVTPQSGGIFRRGKGYFDYVFCIKANGHKNSYALGYSATTALKHHKKYTWGCNDMFIFLSKDQQKNIAHVKYCITGATAMGNRAN